MGVDSRYFFREVSQNFRRNLMLSFSSIATVMVLTFQLGFFILLIANINNFSTLTLSKLQITVILKPVLKDEAVQQLKARIIKHPEVDSVRYISKTQAFDRLKMRMKWQGDLGSLSHNPLPDTMEVYLKNPSLITEIAREIDQYPGVESTRFGNPEIISKLLLLANRIYSVGSAVIVMLLISAVFLISNTIKLTVFSRRKEIAIMELVGAPHWFIRGPFIVEGLIQGLLGAGISVVLLNSFYSAGTRWLIEGIRFIPVVEPGSITLLMNGFLLLTGILVGVLSSTASVNRYLNRVI